MQDVLSVVKTKTTSEATKKVKKTADIITSGMKAFPRKPNNAYYATTNYPIKK